MIFNILFLSRVIYAGGVTYIFFPKRMRNWTKEARTLLSYLFLLQLASFAALGTPQWSKCLAVLFHCISTTREEEFMEFSVWGLTNKPWFEMGPPSPPCLGQWRVLGPGCQPSQQRPCPHFSFQRLHILQSFPICAKLPFPPHPKR